MNPKLAPDRAEDRIPVPQKLACALGGCTGYLAVGLTTGVLWMPFFNIGLGISPGVLGVVLMVLIGWDAITDPIMGHVSDNTRTRWGRRRPFIVIGAILSALMYLVLWRIPSGLGSTAQTGLLLAAGIVFFTCTTIWGVPMGGLRMELTPGYHERTRLAAWTAIAGKIVYLGGGWVLAFATCSWFADPVTGKSDIVRGMHATSWGIAALILVLGILPAIFIKERYYAKVTSKQPREAFWKNLRDSSRCTPLWILIGISFFLGLGNAAGKTLGQYANIYYVNGGDLAAAAVLEGWKSTGVMIVGVVGIPLWTKLSAYLDKKTIVAIMLGCSVAGHLLNLVCLRPDMPYLLLVPAIFEMGALGAVWMFAPAMSADVADYDEFQTGRRREGSLSSFSSWFGKLATTIGAGSGGLLLELTGFDRSLGASQPADVLFRIKWLYICVPVLLWAATLLFIRRYPLNRARMAEIRETLEARRGTV